MPSWPTCPVPASASSARSRRSAIKTRRSWRACPQIQGDILDNVSRYVKPGGVLLYSTCTLLQAENEGVVTAFLAQHPEYHLESFPLPGPLGKVAAGQCTLWPQRLQTDGFFLAKLRKEGAK